MVNDSKFSLKAKLAEKRIAAKMATGKFTSTGVQYTSEQAISDASNPALRMTASTSDNGKLSWSR